MTNLMSSRKLYADLLNLAHSMENDLRLNSLKHSDQNVYACIVLLSEDGNRQAYLNDIKAHKLTKHLSTPSIFNALRKLIKCGLIKKQGTARSGLYALSK